MKASPAAVVVACGVLLAAAGAARAERFAGVKYLGGVKGLGQRMGTLVVENGTMRFEDRKGREVFARSLESASAWLGTEKRTRFGKVLRNIALLPVTMPLTGGNGNPWIGGDRRDSPIAMVKTDADSAPVRLRVPFVQLQQVVDAIGLEAKKAAGSQTPGPETPVAGPPAAGPPVSN